MKKLPITDEDMEALQAIMQKEGLSMNATIHYLITGHKGNTKIRRAKFFFPATLKIEEKALDLFKKGKYDKLIITIREDRMVHEDSFRTLMAILEKGNYTFDKLVRSIVEQERRKKLRFVNGRMTFHYHKLHIEEFCDLSIKYGFDPQDVIDNRVRSLKDYGRDMEQLRMDAKDYFARKKLEDYLNVFLRFNPQYTVKIENLKAKVVRVNENQAEKNRLRAKYLDRTDKAWASRRKKLEVNVETLFNEREDQNGK